jgi:hypothetical protein
LICGCPQINKIFLCCIDIRGHPWLAVYYPESIRVQSVYNPYTSVLVYRKYSYMDGPVTSVVTRYLPVYSHNQHGWFSSGTIWEKN